ncbi:MAG: hypothetical protein H7296_04130 [Bacteroidia bacterium]|nr:hypothetical protein [Bacteroidia bacterium]
MKASNYVILLFILLGLSCKRKAEPFDETSGPVFYAKGFAGNEAINIEAGVNSYYLETDHAIDANRIHEFTGNFKQTCPKCKHSLKVRIRDYHQANGSGFFADSSLVNKDYDYKLNGFSNIPFYTIKLTAIPEGESGLKSHLWEFSDGSTSTKNTLIKTFLSSTDQQIKYTCNYTNTCSSTLSYHVRLNPFLNPVDLPDFKAEKIDSAQIIYQLTAVGDAKNTYLWNMGNGQRLKGKSVFYGFDSSGVFTVSLTRISENDTGEVSKNISVGNVPDCKANFIKELIPFEDPLNLSTVDVEWTNEAGELFTSAGVKQSFYNQFKVLESLGHKTNAGGQPTTLIKLLINCKVSNGSRIIELKNVEAKMAVAHP